MLALRAVVFDFGMVLSGTPNEEAHREMMRIIGLPYDRFEALYWADRHLYDLGVLNGLTFWQKLVDDAGLTFGPETVERLCHLDSVHWTTNNPAMLAWQLKLKEHGLRTAILSNMGDSVLANMKREFDWLDRFDLLVWSFELGLAKPDPAIYHYLLEKLGTAPEETLFLDDKLLNVDAARALGIHALEFSTVDRLRADLIAAGLESELPLPD
jgi:putative hydrolase of the HAD superfamily